MGIWPRTLMALVLLAGTAGAQAFPNTPQLGLGLGTDARDNGNWAVIDNAICGSPLNPSPCLNGLGPSTANSLATSVLAFGVLPNSSADQSAGIQAAIDSGRSPLVFPPGTYIACFLVPRALGQVWQGAGKQVTILWAAPNCGTLIAGTGSSGPAISWELTGFTLKMNTGTSALISMDANGVLRANIHGNALNVGTNQALGATGGATAISWGGGTDLLIENNEFISDTPGYGKAITLFRGARNAIIKNNTWRWVYQGIELANLNGTEDVLIDGNTGDLGWYAEPVKFTNSGGTVTYAASTLTDTAANFSGLCNDAGTPGSCTGNAGNFVRVMTPLINNSNSGNFFGPGVISDASVNYTTAGVKRGNIVRSSPVCQENGPLGQTARASCTGSPGTHAFGDACPCTTGSDCGTGVCAPRFTTVTGVIDTTHLNIDSWVSDTSRRPTTAPDTAGVTYSVYGWVLGQVTSYTATAITVGFNTSGWFDWFGNLSTPAAGTLYEVMTHHPNYNIIVDPNAIVQKGRIVNNTMNRGYSDQIAIQTLASDQLWTVANNQISDGQDIGIDLFATGSVASHNMIDHQGTIGISPAGNVVIDHNTIQDTTWTNTNNTTGLGAISGASTGVIEDHNVIRYTGIGMVLNRYGITLSGTSTGTLLDNNTFTGTFSTAPYNLQGAGITAAHIRGYNGETINAVSAPTFSIEGGLATEAQITANAALPGSFCGCSDCTVANPCAAAGTGAVAKREGTAWVCN